MKPRDVRRLVLVDHLLIRDLLTELEALLGLAASGQRKLDGTARRRARDLRRLFVAHLALQENHLVPVLRDGNARAEARAARLISEHDHQRQHLETLLRHLAERHRPASELVIELHDLVAEFLEGMLGEEAAVQAEDFLSGDAVPIDFGAR
jgi:hemerythrin-like domain-containing protein